ncbi:hypothetical protein [Candidatus Marinarcus aquaticus]|uniref:hypothetical protein n=1 Tax=Candidatus Marinarcus aquaticus TaxID=2044504 RepID=UPI0013E95B46|nr:hypothetical protein [Candidatus Marinarcus aquaticus]
MTLDLILDVLFRLAIAIAGITGAFMFFGSKAPWLRKCHLIMGASAVILCVATFIVQYT